MLHKHILSYFNIIIILLLLHNVPWISFQLVYIIFSIKVFSHVLVYIYIYTRAILYLQSFSQMEIGRGFWVAQPSCKDVMDT